MGGGSNIGRFDLGLTGVRNPIQDFIENQLMEALQVPVKAGDHPAAKKRFENVRDLLNQLSPQQAGELLDHLNESHSRDPLAKEIKYRFSDSSVEELKKNLEITSGRWAHKHLGHEDTLLRGPKDNGGQLKSETEASGKTKRSHLEEIWNAYMNAEKIHSALNAGDGVDEKAISETLSNLTKKEKKDLKRAYKEKYGEDLQDSIKKETSNGGIFGSIIGAVIKDMLN